MKNIKKVLAAAVLLSFSYQIIARDNLSISKLHVDELYFPANFLFGFAIAEQQNSGENNTPQSNWTRWERTAWPDGTPHIERGERSGSAADHWNLYKEDIKLMKNDFQVNAFRFSVAWDRIEPQEGQFDEEALKHYCNEVDELIKNDIVPMITLHHFSHPVWFEDKGGFEKEENIAYFVRFSKRVFEVLGHKVPFWCTINEPGIFAFQGYLPWNCVFPPGYARTHSFFESYAMGATVIRNMMQAHVEVYHALKNMPGGDKAQIGLVHQYLLFKSFSWWNPIEKVMGFGVNNLISHSILEFLKTGRFCYQFGYKTIAQYESPYTKFSDFVGLNYYSRVLVEMKWSKLMTGDFKNVVVPSCYEDEIMTDMPYPIYAQGIYEALQAFSETKLPIIITENGIDDRQPDDWKRALWIKHYAKMVSLALEDGINVLGFFYWSLTRNFEWNMGWGPRFGVYDVDLATQKRTLSKGALPYAAIIDNFRKGLYNNHTQDYHADA